MKRRDFLQRAATLAAAVPFAEGTGSLIPDFLPIIGFVGREQAQQQLTLPGSQ